MSSSCDEQLDQGGDRSSSSISHSSHLPAPLSFWAFDLLWLEGDLLIDEPYADRRAALEALDLAGPCAVLPRFEGTDAQDLLAACVDHDVMVLERLASRYRPGERSTGSWSRSATVWAAPSPAEPSTSSSRPSETGRAWPSP